MTWLDAFRTLGELDLSSSELRAFGATSHSLTAAVRGGYLIRARRDHYLLPDTDPHIVRAVRVGGRLGCVSLLSHAGVFAFDASATHLHLDQSMSRARSPRDRRFRLTRCNRENTRLHWSPLIDEPGRTGVSPVDALVESLRCQHPWHALASLDSALHLGMITEGDLSRIFAATPRRLRYLRPLVDGRAEAGQETVLRMIIRDAGLQCDLQVVFPGIGRVDILVEGCLVVEADSRLAHDGWEKHVEDRGRDLALASLGMMSLRPAFQHTMHNPELVRSAILGLVAQGRGFTPTR